MDALGINLGFFLFQVFNFVIVMVLLYAWAYQPIVNALENRKNKIAQSLEDARIAAEARANAEAEARAILTKAQSEAAEKVREATQRAEVATQDVRNAAEAEAAKIREGAVADATVERDRVLGDLRGQIATLAIAATQKLIGEALDERRQRGLIDEFFSGLKSGSVTVLEGADAHAQAAEITSALPLTDAEKETVRTQITSKVGAQTVAFRVDPGILGGLVVKVGDKVMDASVAGRLENLRGSLS
jgi:F-type H+-transporting ATPase subunit b